MRRQGYHACGPKLIWYMDRYDIGMCTNGYICGFSRKIIWLNVIRSTMTQKHWWLYLLEAVTARCVAAFQTFLRRNDPDDDRPYIYDYQRRAGGDIYERNTCNRTELFKHLLYNSSGVSMKTFWTGMLYCSVSYH